ncbi:MAG: outer membrane protein assembly factor BamD [Candidatus Aminicenantaceae bacterium]
MNKIMIFTTVCILLLSTSGCKKEEVQIDPEIASNDEALYQQGMEFIEKNPEKGRLYLRQVIDSFPKSFYAQRAKLAIADSYFEKGDEGSMVIAASEYREFISLFPYSPSAAYAQYRIAMTFFEKALSVGRDQTKTKRALEEFKQVVTRYPMSEEAELADEKILECEERLAEHSLNIAVHYYKRKGYKATISRLTELLTEYPNFSMMDEVYFYLADAYYQSGSTDQSVPYFRKLISDYPQSDHAEDARERLQEIEKDKEEKKNE